MQETQPLYIYGAGGMGREIAAMVRSLPGWELKGFFDDGLKKGTLIDGFPVFGGASALDEFQEPLNLVLGLGNPVVKRQVHQLLVGKEINYPNLIHPSAILQSPDNIRLGQGIVITAGCVLTTGIDIGDHVLLNLHVTVGHDAMLGAFTSIMPGVNIAGLVRIGEEVLVGAGANIINGLKVGNKTRIGAGAVVITDIPTGVTAVGVPAQYKKSRG